MRKIANLSERVLPESYHARLVNERSRMFDCPATVLPELIYDKKGDFYRLIKYHHHLRIDGTKAIVLKNYVKDHPENIWEILEQDGVFIHENESFVKEVENSPILSLRRPTDIFVYDYQDMEKFNKAKELGSIFINKQDLNLSTLVDHWKYTVAEFENPSWHDFFTGLYDEPCSLVNSLVLVDRYIFNPPKPFHTNYMNGVQNIYDILYETIPGKLDSSVPFQVLIVFDDTAVSGPRPFEDNMNVVGRAIQKMKKKLIQCLKEKYGKEFVVSIELLAISREDGSVIYNDTHNRKIISNSFLIKSDRGFNAFIQANRTTDGIETDVCKKRKMIFEQDLSLNFNYDELSNKRARSFTSYSSDITLNVLKEYIAKIKKEGGTFRFMKDGRCDADISELENRLVVSD